MMAAIAADPNITFETQEGVAPIRTVDVNAEVPPPAAQAATTAEVPPQQEATGEAPKVKIGGKEFATEKEAWAYVEKLEEERLAADRQ